MACRQFPKCYSLDLKEFGVPIPEDVSDVDSAYRRGHMQYHALERIINARRVYGFLNLMDSCPIYSVDFVKVEAH
jgi:Ser-tRNA(Ala) deacylase AlaX